MILTSSSDGLFLPQTDEVHSFSERLGEKVRSTRYYTYLSVPEVSAYIVGLLAKLQGHDFMHIISRTFLIRKKKKAVLPAHCKAERVVSAVVDEIELHVQSFDNFGETFWHGLQPQIRISSTFGSLELTSGSIRISYHKEQIGSIQ